MKSRKVGIVLFAVLLLLPLGQIVRTAAVTIDVQPRGAEILLLSEPAQQEVPSYRDLHQGLMLFTESRQWQFEEVLTQPETKAQLGALEESRSDALRLVICVGYDFAQFVYVAQEAHPELLFLLLDAEPKNEQSGHISHSLTTHSILFSDAEAGFMTGYGSVFDGARSIALCAEVTQADSISYAYGFLDGAAAAARRLGLLSEELTVHYIRVENGMEAADFARLYTEGRDSIVLTPHMSDESGAALMQAAAEIQATAEIQARAIILGGAPSGQVYALRANYEAALFTALRALEDEDLRYWPPGLAGESCVLGLHELAFFLEGEGQDMLMSGEEHSAALQDLSALQKLASFPWSEEAGSRNVALVQPSLGPPL